MLVAEGAVITDGGGPLYTDDVVDAAGVWDYGTNFWLDESADGGTALAPPPGNF